MNTVTLKVKDEFIDEFMSYLNSIPKDKIIIEKISDNLKKQKNIEITSEKNETEETEEVKIKLPSILIRVKKLSQENHKKLPEIELFDPSFHSWQINIENIKKVKYAFSIYKNTIKEVYLVFNWRLSEDKLRYELIGTLADDSVRKKYVNKSVENYFPFGASNPVRMLNI